MRASWRPRDVRWTGEIPLEISHFTLLIIRDIECLCEISQTFKSAERDVSLNHLGHTLYNGAPHWPLPSDMTDFTDDWALTKSELLWPTTGPESQFDISGRRRSDDPQPLSDFSGLHADVLLHVTCVIQYRVVKKYLTPPAISGSCASRTMDCQGMNP
jgi:hypothetical protein